MTEDEATAILACIAANGGDRRLIRAVVEAVMIDAAAAVRPVVRLMRVATRAVEPPEPLEEPELDPEPPEDEDEAPAAVEPEVVASNGHTPRASIKIGVTMAQAIRTRYWSAEDEPSYNGLAKEFDVTPQTVTNIIKRASYSDAPFVPGEAGYEEAEKQREALIQARRERAAEGLPR